MSGARSQAARRRPYRPTLAPSRRRGGSRARWRGALAQYEMQRLESVREQEAGPAPAPAGPTRVCRAGQVRAGRPAAARGAAAERRRGQQPGAAPAAGGRAQRDRLLPPDLVRGGLPQLLGRVPLGGRPGCRPPGAPPALPQATLCHPDGLCYRPLRHAPLALTRQAARVRLLRAGEGRSWAPAPAWPASTLALVTGAVRRPGAQVCGAAGVPLEVVPLTGEYWQRVVQHCLGETRAGRTPNPDVLCNSRRAPARRPLPPAGRAALPGRGRRPCERARARVPIAGLEAVRPHRVKFGAFYDHLAAAHPGAFDRVASGHYARLLRPGGGAAAQLALTRDAVKDQTYFLAGLSRAQLERAMFPLGPLTKACGALIRTLPCCLSAPVMLGAVRAGGCPVGARRAGATGGGRARRRRCGGWPRRRACRTRRGRTARASASWARRGARARARPPARAQPVWLAGGWRAAAPRNAQQMHSAGAWEALRNAFAQSARDGAGLLFTVRSRRSRAAESQIGPIPGPPTPHRRGCARAGRPDSGRAPRLGACADGRWRAWGAGALRRVPARAPGRLGRAAGGGGERARARPARRLLVLHARAAPRHRPRRRPLARCPLPAPRAPAVRPPARRWRV